MVSWGIKRQFAYVMLVIGVLGVLVALPAFLILYNPPTCADGEQNQGEFGVDCGGPCSILCPAKALAPIVHWQQEFEINPGVWSVAGYVENPNLDSGAYNVPYTFKLYDDRNILIAERRGFAYIPPRREFVLFEGGILTGERKPSRTLLEFSKNITWQKDFPVTPELRIANRLLTETASPRVDADIMNPTLSRVANTEIVAILYDVNENALGVSRTSVDEILPNETKKLVFTWPKAFARPIAKFDLIYRVAP